MRDFVLSAVREASLHSPDSLLLEAGLCMLDGRENDLFDLSPSARGPRFGAELRRRMPDVTWSLRGHRSGTISEVCTENLYEGPHCQLMSTW